MPNIVVIPCSRKRSNEASRTVAIGLLTLRERPIERQGGRGREAATYRDFEDYWTPFLAGVGPAGAYCASLEERDREALRGECERRLESPAGSFSLNARAWSVVGRVPRD